MKLRLSNLSGPKHRLASLRAVWIVAPIVVGVGVALYLRRKKLAGRIGARTPSIATSNIRCVEKPPVSLDEWVSEPQIQPDVMPDFSGIPTSLPVATSEASDAKETRAAEFVIPTLIATSEKFAPGHSTPAAVHLATRKSRSRRRSARRLVAAGLTFLVTAAIVYGTVGAVRSHQRNIGPLLFADATPPPASDAPGEGPKFDAIPAEHSKIPPADQAPAAIRAENLGAAPSESPDSPVAQTPPPSPPRKIHRPHSHSRHSGTAKSKTKTPWKVSF